MRRQLLAAGALACLLLTSGCVSVTVHSTVSADGTIDEYDLRANMSRQAFGYVQQAAEEDGYDSVGAYMLSDMNESVVDRASYETEYNGDQVSMHFELTDISAAEMDSITVEKSEGTMTYVDRAFVNRSADRGQSDSEIGQAISSGMTLDYYLTMPGEVTDSNAQSVDGNSAEWHRSGGDAFSDTRVYAESDVPTFGFAPGFGVGTGIVALLVSTFLLRRRGKSQSKRTRTG